MDCFAVKSFTSITVFVTIVLNTSFLPVSRSRNAYLVTDCNIVTDLLRTKNWPTDHVTDVNFV